MFWNQLIVSLERQIHLHLLNLPWWLCFQTVSPQLLAPESLGGENHIRLGNHFWTPEWNHVKVRPILYILVQLSMQSNRMVSSFTLFPSGVAGYMSGPYWITYWSQLQIQGTECLTFPTFWSMVIDSWTSLFAFSSSFFLSLAITSSLLTTGPHCVC